MAFAEENHLIIFRLMGSYNELSTNKLAVGYSASADQPKTDGDIRLKPHTSAPPTESGVPGEIAYAKDGFLYAHNGTNWVKQGGGLDAYVKTGTNPTCGSGYSEEMRYWKSRTCQDHSCRPDCITLSLWSVFTEPPWCYYSPFQGGSCRPEVKGYADSWSKVLCVKN